MNNYLEEDNILPLIIDVHGKIRRRNFDKKVYGICRTLDCDLAIMYSSTDLYNMECDLYMKCEQNKGFWISYDKKRYYYDSLKETYIALMDLMNPY